jgi:NAD kinase
VERRIPRVVVITRATELQELVARHGTREQARFFLRTHGRELGPLEDRQRAFEAAHEHLLAAIPADWRRSRVSRADLDRFLFEPDDLVVVLGQDGLVANVAKYLDGQHVVGFDPEPGRNEGVLVRHAPEAASTVFQAWHAGRMSIEERVMVAARAGQRTLLALNEIFVGHASHQSARYTLTVGKMAERQSSSGLIVASGTGATGWARSIHRERAASFELPAPTAAELAWFVREAWPSRWTQADLTAGRLAREQELVCTCEMDGGVVFGDGIEGDRLLLSHGESVRIACAPRRLRLVV